MSTVLTSKSKLEYALLKLGIEKKIKNKVDFCSIDQTVIHFGKPARNQ